MTTPSTRPRIAGKQPRRRPAAPSPPSSDSSPPPSDEDGDDDDDDRRRGLRRRLDFLNEDQQRARGRRFRNTTHTNTVTTVYEEGVGGGDPPCAVPRPEPPVQIHQQHHAVAQRVDVVDDHEKKDIKTASLKTGVEKVIEHGTQTQTIGC